MKTSYLIWIERLILEEGELLFTPDLKPELVEYHEARLIQTTNSIKREILIRLEALAEDNKAAGPTIQLLQNKLTHYQDLLYDLSIESWSDPAKMSHYKLAISLNNRITELQEFMEDSFPESYNLDARISKITLAGLQEECAEIVTRWTDINRLIEDEPIFKLAISPLLAIMNRERKTVSIARKRYLVSYIKELETISIVPNQNEQIKQFKNVILRCNLNSPKSFQVLSSEVTAAMKSHGTIDQKIYFLFEQLRYFNGMNTGRNIIYNPLAKPIIQQLINWIVDEVKYLKKELDFKKDMQLLLEGTTALKLIKLKTELSVGELSLFARLLTDTDIIKTKQVTDIIRWLAATVESKNQAEVSEKSLRKKYYDPDLNSREKMEKHLKKLTAHLKELP